jgi:hypothetical protein
MRKILVSLTSLALLLALAGSAWAGPYVPDPDVYGKIKGAYQPIGLVGRIAYSKKHGGYYIKNNPRYGFGNKVILGRLARRSRVHTISARVSPMDWRATYVYIEAIDGYPYHGRHAPLVRLY